MQIIHGNDYADMSRKAAEILLEQVRAKKDSVLGLATGSTPIGIYAQTAEHHRAGDADFSQVRTVNLDEYVGLAQSHPQSYRYFMEEHLFRHVNILPANTHVPDGMASDAHAECARYEALIAQLGGIDLQLLGLGHNGHIGFNEPADFFPNTTHQVALAQSTIQANRRFFESEEQVPRHAYTMGIGTIMRARQILIVVSGKDKANIVSQAFGGPITPQVPASILQLHNHVTLVGDAEALSELG